MKYILSLILIFIITSCSSEYEPSSNETKEIFTAATKIFNINKGTINKNNWPSIFNKINANEITIKKHGLYIQLSESFVEESGLFVPSKNFKVNIGPQYDPSYTEISNGVYKYRIKG